MRDEEHWKPTKYVFSKGRFGASRDPRVLGIGSRLIANLLADEYASLLPAYASGSLADMGCGAVPFYQFYRQHVSEITCVDWSGSRHRARHVDFFCDLGKGLPFPEAHFDTILLSDVLEHIAEPRVTMAELFRVLKSDGYLILNVPFFYPLHEVPYDFYRYTHFGLRHLAENSGFNVRYLAPVGGALEVIVNILAKLLVHVKIMRPVARILQASCYTFGRSKWGRRLAAKTAGSYPLGYIMVAHKA